MFKRTVDIAFAIFLLTLTLPFLAIVALIVKLDSEGPVIFRQARMGRNFKRFQLYKLRTMNWCGRGSAYTLGADPRITRAGRWLRKLKLDELPQLWNVLRGDMSLVGPRPVIPELALEFEWAYKRLLKVRPGLTDPATLKYRNETEILAGVADPLRYFLTVVTPEKLCISQDYLQRANAWTDFAVMVRTALALAPPALRVRFSSPAPNGPDGDAESLLRSRPIGLGRVHPAPDDLLDPVQFEIPAAIIEGSRLPRPLPAVKPLPV